MQITVFGATGRTGVEVVKQALDRNHEVTTLVRNPEKLGELREKVTVFQGDIANQNVVAEAVMGADAVVSVIGQTKHSQPDFQTRAIETIIKAMKQAGTTRLISLTGAGVRAAGDNPKFTDKAFVAVMRVVAGKVLTDGVNHAELIKNSGLEWTIVRGPVLTNKPARGNYAAGMVGDSNLKISIARADMAAFIIDIAEKGGYIARMPLVANRK